MVTREILENSKDEAINLLINRLNKYKSYKNGQQDAKKRAADIYDNAMKLHNEVVRWWKITKDTKGDVVASTKHSAEVVKIKTTKEIEYNDDVIQRASVTYFHENAQNKKSFRGTRAEMIEFVKTEML